MSNRHTHHKPMTESVFSRRESRARSYALTFPAVFTRAEGARLYDENDNAYIDFLAGAGSLNYGHNHPVLREALVDYIEREGIAHSLDLHTAAKAEFLQTFEDLVLKPRGHDYVVQFTGPTGTNAVEAALKLARKVKGRTGVVSFTNGFHGVTLGALAATGNSHHRNGAGVPLTATVAMPYDGYLGGDVDTIAYLEKMLTDPSSGVDMPAAVIVETVQGEGGLNAARMEWLRALSRLCTEQDILLIIDDIQAGCGRTGSFFSFEPADIKPDLVALSKSLSGFGLPFALTLVRRELDIWEPGEHNGTFRGNNHAFVTATAALRHFWASADFSRAVARKADLVKGRLDAIASRNPGFKRKGRGLMQGLDCGSGARATAISAAAYRQGLIAETGGPFGEVLKCLCPLTIDEEDLTEGMEIISACVEETAPPMSWRTPSAAE